LLNFEKVNKSNQLISIDFCSQEKPRKAKKTYLLQTQAKSKKDKVQTVKPTLTTSYVT